MQGFGPEPVPPARRTDEAPGSGIPAPSADGDRVRHHPEASAGPGTPYGTPGAGSAGSTGSGAGTPSGRDGTAGFPRRRAGGDPVKALMHRHRELCERAVGPLEIAAGLEAAGVTDRTAARCRHRDVFSLAEEIHARVPRPATGFAPETRPAPPRDRLAALRTTARAVSPAGLAALAALLSGPVAGGWAAVLTGIAVALAFLWPAGPHAAVRAKAAALPRWAAAAAAAGVAYAVHVHGAALGVGLALAALPAHWAAAWYSDRARRRLRTAPTLDDFAASVRPLPFAATAGYAAAALPVLALTGAPLGTAAPVALLLFLARLLCAHRGRRAAAAALALGLLPFPGLAVVLAGAAAVHVTVALSRASAHVRRPHPGPGRGPGHPVSRHPEPRRGEDMNCRRIEQGAAR
ncbi:hypothetical protein [Streptomyces sp. NPDC089799]|uniref:hypothetical protein n=1 Tax=Streptomyces sp. NPDC089799 TaxID=3155066 RepID=UPI0034225CE4